MDSLLMTQVQPHERTGAAAMMYMVIFARARWRRPIAGAGLTRLGYPAIILIAAALLLCGALLFGCCWRGRDEAFSVKQQTLRLSVVQTEVSNGVAASAVTGTGTLDKVIQQLSLSQSVNCASLVSRAARPVAVLTIDFPAAIQRCNHLFQVPRLDQPAVFAMTNDVFDSLFPARDHSFTRGHRFEINTTQRFVRTRMANRVQRFIA